MGCWEMPKPNETHQRIAANAGTWSGVETMFPSVWDPQGGEARATMRSRVGLDGFAVIGDYEQTRGGSVSFRGHAVWTVDPKNGEIILTWFDSLGMLPETFRGRFEGDALQVKSHTEQGWNRLTNSYPEPGKMTSRMEMSQDGQNWSPLFEGSYRKEA